MAKKPAQKRESSEPKLKTVLRKFILKESDISGEPSVPQMDFYFEVSSIKGNSKSPKMNIFKPKKENFIELGSKVIIHPQHLKIFEADPQKRLKLFNEIKRVCLIKNVSYILNQKDYFVMLDRIYLEPNKNLSMNRYHKTFRNVLNSVLYALVLFGNIGKNKDKADDSIIGDPSLYS